MTHEHDFLKDLDGQVTCSICGAMDDDKEQTVIEKVQVLCFFCGATFKVDIDKVDTRKRCDKCSD